MQGQGCQAQRAPVYLAVLSWGQGRWPQEWLPADWPGLQQQQHCHGHPSQEQAGPQGRSHRWSHDQQGWVQHLGGQAKACR